ncbi:rust resistance kinase Lr10-like [Cicer arietinum]|uniref:Rust resistance kinase Lr10-like n=1 Tax=Cicer arietinum TaxID=3827 RepID=A0A1S2Y2P3_CICAR|nr:rust resistance kinase Lr10-like [Cicer arietinum]
MKLSLMTILLALLLLLLLMKFGSCHQSNKSSIICPYRLSCSNHFNQTIEFPSLPNPTRFHVIDIDCQSQRLYLSHPQNCLSNLFLDNNFSLFFPFETPYPFSNNITFFNCSNLVGKHQHHLKSFEQYTYYDKQDMLSCPIYFADSTESVVELDLLQCTRMFDKVLPVLASELRVQYAVLSLKWSETNFDSQCLEYELHNKSKKHTSIILATTGAIVGSTVMVTLIGLIFRVYLYFRIKGEDQIRLENFLNDYKASKPTRFSYADIKRITEQFREKLGEGAHGAVYKGNLSSQIQVAVKILNNTEGDGREFINEVGTMGKIHHVNVVRLLGFCADGFHRALVYDFFPNGSLQKFISHPSNKDSFLGWDKLQHIAIGIANGIEYLHQGCDQRILHFDINPHNVLLDDNFIPKISDFGLAKLCSKNQSIVSMTVARGTLGYMAPEVFSRNFGNVSYKSDIYSYGMLLLEIVGGRKNTSTKTTTSEENFQVLYPDWIHTLLEGGDIQISIDEDGDFRIAKKLAIIGLWCIQWQPMHRPSMKTVVQMLQGDGEKLKVPSNPFIASSSTYTSTNSATGCLNLELEVIQELD